jgi:HK97 family phage major capsid protein
VITEELARFSDPSAELLVRNEMIEGLTRFFDGIFVSTTAAVSNVQPAGILNGISGTAAGATTAVRFRYDMNVIIQQMITDNRDPSKLVLLMSAGTAMSLGSMINSLANPEFPGINAKGGEYLGIPIVVSQALGTNIILIDPGDILIAEDPSVRIDVSREATIEMDTAPAVGESSPITTVSTIKSFWQNNLVGIRAEQFRTWKVARSSAVRYISGAAYAPPTA